MGRQVHRFGNLIFDLDVYASTEGYHKALDRARDLYMQQVLPRLEEVLDELVPPELVVEMDSLVIDLGDIGRGNWEVEFVEQCVAKFAQQLRDLLGRNPAKPGGGEGIKVSTPAEWQPQQLLRYLETGSFGAAASSLPAARVLLAEWLDKDAEAVLRVLGMAHGHSVIARRLVYQFPGDLVERLRRLLLPNVGKAPIAAEVLQGLRTLALGEGFPASAVERGLRVTEVWLLLEALAHRSGNASEGQALFRERILAMGITAEWAAKHTTLRFEPGGELDLIVRFCMEMRVATPSARKSSKQEAIPPTSKAIQKTWDVVLQALRKKAARLPDSNALRKKALEVTAEMLSTRRLGEGDALPVSFAGIVLLNPFVQEFFEHLQLVKDGTFLDDAAQHRGVYLLHCLATFSEEVEEGELALLKLICGLPVTEPVFLESPLTEMEIAACTELLKAVIDYWPPMEGSAPEALQEAFLRRAGTLEQGGTGYRLRVEVFMLDVLLAKLPWGLSIVHYPWMEGLLYVEWG